MTPRAARRLSWQRLVLFLVIAVAAVVVLRLLFGESYITTS